MRIIVLGAAAGGGFPQWNANGVGCRRARRGDPLARARSQASIAASGDGVHWFVFNASPDLRQQINATPALHPRRGLRDTPICGVVPTNGDVDAIAGLLVLRERQPFTLYATRKVMDVIDANSIFDVLARDVVTREVVPLERSIALRAPDGADAGLAMTLFAVPGKVPLYLEGDHTPSIAQDGYTVGARLDAGDSHAFFISGCARMTPELAERLRGAGLVFFDGTLWRDDEMIAGGAGTKTGQRMGHMSLDGPQGTLAAFASLAVRRKVLIHINNTNPVLMDDSRERLCTDAAGWEVGYDGMELEC